MTEQARCADKGGGQVTLAERTIARVCANCFSGAEFIAPKPRPNTVSQFGSRYRRGLGRRALKIMGEYDPVTAIAIRPLTQPRMCGMGSSVFSAMSWLKVVSMTRESFLSMPPTERTNGEKCLFLSWQCLPCLSFFCFSQQARSLSIRSCV